ncbi:MAG: restriction endonuclease subunit S [Minisyncoccales bacterium]
MKTNYPTKKLGEVCEISAGNSVPQGKNFFKNGKYSLFRTSDVGAVHISDNFSNVRDYLNDEGIKKLKLFKKGTILLPKSGASTFLNHRVVMGCDGYVSSHLATILAGENVDHKYLYFYLFTIDAKKITANTSYPSLKLSDIGKIEIPLPPLETQKKIVAKLESLLGKINEAKKLRAEAQEKTENLLSAELHKIFSEGKDKYESEGLGNVAELVRGPFGGSLRKDMFVDEGYAVYEQGNVIKNNTVSFRYFISEEKFKEMKRFEVSSGDILMSCSGTIGRLAIVPSNNVPGIINQALLKISPNEKISTNYLRYTLYDYVLRNMLKHTTGSAIKNIVAVSILKKIKIPLPPLSEQKKIVARLDSLSQKVDQVKKLQKTTETELTTLEQSILHKAFNGELI